MKPLNRRNTVRISSFVLAFVLAVSLLGDMWLVKAEELVIPSESITAEGELEVSSIEPETLMESETLVDETSSEVVTETGSTPVQVDETTESITLPPEEEVTSPASSEIDETNESIVNPSDGETISEVSLPEESLVEETDVTETSNESQTETLPVREETTVDPSVTSGETDPSTDIEPTDSEAISSETELNDSEITNESATKDPEESEVPVKSRAVASDFEISNGVLIKYNGLGPIVNIPTNVYEIGENAFAGNTAIQQVNFSKNVHTIQSGAFEDCVGLRTVNLNSGLKSLSETGHIFHRGAFEGCTGLQSLTLPSTLTYIGRGSFASCIGLRTINLENLQTIGENAFAGTPITFANLSSIRSIGYSAFEGCSSLASLTLGSSLQTMGDSAFKSCSSLESVILPGSLQKIPQSAFASNTALKTVIIQSGVNEIEYDDWFYSGAFQNCTSLHTVSLPSSLTKVGKQSFLNCTSLKNINLANVQVAGDYAFQNTAITAANLSSIRTIGESAFRETPLSYVNFGNQLIYMGDFAFRYCTSLTEVTIPGSLAKVPVGAFANSSNLTTVTLSYGVTSIADATGWFDAGAFENCTNLKSIVLPGSLTKIGVSAFTNTALAEVSIPSSVTTIGDYAFRKISSLRTAYIPANVTVMGRDVFVNSDPTIYGQRNTRAESYANEYQLRFVVAAVMPSPVTNLRASLRSKGSIQLNWTASPNAEGYIIYRKIGNGSFVYRYLVKGNSFVDSGLTSTQLHYYRVYPYSVASNGTRLVAGSLNAVSKYPNLSALTNLRVGINQYGTLTTLWNSVPGADGYIIYRKQGDEAIKYRYMVTTNYYVDHLANFPVPYVYIVYPYQNTNTGRRILGPSTKHVYAIPLPTIAANLRVRTVGRSNQLNWNGAPGATGYIIKRMGLGQTQFQYLSMTANKGYIDTVSRAGTYFYRVYPYRTINGKMVWGTSKQYVYAINR